MNYLGDPNKITKIYYKDFIAKFDEDYKSKGITWEATYEKIKQIVREAFIAARVQYPQMHSEKVTSVLNVLCLNAIFSFSRSERFTALI